MKPTAAATHKKNANPHSKHQHLHAQTTPTTTTARKHWPRVMAFFKKRNAFVPHKTYGGGLGSPKNETQPHAFRSINALYRRPGFANSATQFSAFAIRNAHPPSGHRAFGGSPGERVRPLLQSDSLILVRNAAATNNVAHHRRANIKCIRVLL